MDSLVPIVAIGVCAFAVVLVIGSLWLFIWTRRIPRRALRKTARACGVSEAYLHVAITNNDDWLAGRITPDEWERRAMKIAYQFPQDSGIRAHLREQEGLCE